MSRRTALKSIARTSAAIWAAPLARSFSTAKVEWSPVVRTSGGAIQGQTRNSGFAFFGIPYGAPTGGSARFMPPRPPEPWIGVRSTTVFGDSCPQVALGLSPFTHPSSGNAAVASPTPMQLRLAGLSSRASADIRSSEDCLALNVWTPALDSAKRPVMVWLHGGGFAVGSGSSPLYDGTRLSQRKDVIVVTINHRLNVFGYLYLGQIGGEKYGNSANVGMLDVVLALEWIRDNIASFGGDPGNVTIFGESGGAGKVSVLCGMPAATGLFHKAIMQSGPCLKVADIDDATAVSTQLLTDLQIKKFDLSKLHEIDAVKLAAAASAAEMKAMPRVLGKPSRGLIPVVDGQVIRRHPFDSIAAPESAHVPLLLGSTGAEAILFVGALPRWGHFARTDIESFVRPLAGERVHAAIELYGELHPSDSASYLLADIVTDCWLRRAANVVAELKVRQSAAPAFVYVLEWEIDPILRTPHGADVPLVFDTIAASPAMAGAPDAQRVADQMSDAWAAFARTGSPNTSKIPHWPAYTLEDRGNMLFDVRSHVANDFGKRARIFWK